MQLKAASLIISHLQYSIFAILVGMAVYEGVLGMTFGVAHTSALPASHPMEASGVGRTMIVRASYRLRFLPAQRQAAGLVFFRVVEVHTCSTPQPAVGLILNRPLSVFGSSVLGTKEYGAWVNFTTGDPSPPPRHERLPQAPSPLSHLTGHRALRPRCWICAPTTRETNVANYCASYCAS